jgi:hypothetical protein
MMSDLTDNQWQAAHAIARYIVQGGANAGELKKAMAYLRTCADAPDGGTRFFKYLGNLVSGGNRIGHSKRTVEYYRGLNEACIKYLQPLQDSPQVMLEILGWAGRLIAYYQASPIAELANASMEIEAESAKQAAIKAAAAEAKFELGRVVPAIIKAMKGKEVTYELTGGIKLTQKEPKNADKLSVDQSVQVEIIEMRETGVPKKLRLVG